MARQRSDRQLLCSVSLRIFQLLKLLLPKAILSQQCTKYRLMAGLRPDPLGELTALPSPITGLKEPTSKEGEGNGVGKGGEGREGRGEGKGRIGAGK